MSPAPERKLIRRESKLNYWKYSHPDNYHKAQTWQDKVIHLLQSRTAHIVVMALLVIDIILVAVSIGLEIEALNHEVRECEDVVDSCREHNDEAICNTDDIGKLITESNYFVLIFH
jgi:hypothetical protein